MGLCGPCGNCGPRPPCKNTLQSKIVQIKLVEQLNIEGLLQIGTAAPKVVIARPESVELRREGLDPGGYVVDRDLKYAMPLSCLVMVALAMVLSLDPLPRNMSLGRSFGLAIAIGFGYWLALGLTSSLGRSATFPAWVAAWLPNITFATIGASIFLLGEEH